MRALTFTGVLLDTGELQLQPGFLVEAERPGDDDGDLAVEAVARDGQVIATTRLTLVNPCGYPTSDVLIHPPRVAVGTVEFPEQASGLRVIHEGRTLLERSAPRASARPRIQWPDALDTGIASVSWRVPQPDAAASLGYSNDDGKTWSPLSLPGGERTIPFDADRLPGGDRCLLELAVTDGFHTTRHRSQTYQVKPKGWVLWILAPGSGAALSAGEPVLLAAQGYHLEERRPSVEGIAWTSSVSGGLGEGAQVMAAFGPGEHVITATMAGVSAEIRVSVSAH
jgi:hypothetical protein